MALRLGALYDALLAATGKPELATKAAEEVANYDNRLNSIESDLKLLKWMVGFNLAMTVAVVFRVFGG